MLHLRRHLTYANVAATLALFLACGGGAYAAFKLPARSVGTRQLKNHAVTPAKLSRKTKALLKEGKPGPQGLPGTPGPAGPSDIYAAGTAFKPFLSTSYTSLGGFTVPAGSYLLQAKVTLSSAGASSANCLLANNAPTLTQWDAGDEQHNAASRDVMTLSGVATFSAPQFVQLLCKSPSGTVSADDARVIAIRTGALHGTTPVD